MKEKIALIILTLAASSTLGQTAKDIESKFGKPTDAYSVSEHVWMTPEYDADGEVCQMRFYPKRIGPNIDFLSKHLLFDQLTVLLNQLVPPHIRGVKKPGFGLTDTGGGAAWTTYGYEKVTFTFIFALRLEPGPLRGSLGLTFPVDELKPKPKTEDTSPTFDDFLPSKTSNNEIVTVKWNDRKCLVLKDGH